MNDDNLSFNPTDLQLLKSNVPRKNKFFWPDEKHLVGQTWSVCHCMTCVSDYEDQLVKQDELNYE